MLNSKHKYDYEKYKFVDGNCGLINEYVNDLCKNKHFLRSSEGKVWKTDSGQYESWTHDLWLRKRVDICSEM